MSACVHLLLLLLVSSCLSIATAVTSVPFGRAHSAAIHSWQPQHRVPSTDPHSFVWLFPTRNSDWLQAEVAELSDPASARYLQHHSFEDVQARIGPAAEDKERVKQWLADGLVGAEVEDYGHALQVTTTVDDAERLFNTTMHYFVHQPTQRTATLAIDAVSVPVELAPHLDRLDGLYNYPMPVATKTTTYHSVAPTAPHSAHAMHTMQLQETDSQCAANHGGQYVTVMPPELLAVAYNYNDRSNTTTHQRTISAVVGGFSVYSVNNVKYNEAFSQADLTHFQAAIGYAEPFVASTFGSSNNAANELHNVAVLGYNATNEASLDIQALFQINPTGTNGFYAVTGTTTSLLASLTGIAALPLNQRPQVVSYSYSFGYSEWDYMTNDQGATEVALQQLAALGITVVVGAGDDGTAGMYNRQCATAATLDAISSLDTQYAPPAYLQSPMQPNYPASSAYVLSVGETEFLGGLTSSSQYLQYFSQSITSPPICNNCPSDQTVGYYCQDVLSSEDPVSTSNLYTGNGIGTTTGGGFSYLWPRPAWQESLVSSYLADTCGFNNSNGCELPSLSLFNYTNRAYPDVAAFGGYFSTIVNGKQTVQVGTSVSAPLWAGFIARLNEVSRAYTGASLGLVNHAAVQDGRAEQPNTFNDITQPATTSVRRPTPNVWTQYAAGNLNQTTCSGFMATPGWDPVAGAWAVPTSTI